MVRQGPVDRQNVGVLRQRRQCTSIIGMIGQRTPMRARAARLLRRCVRRGVDDRDDEYPSRQVCHDVDQTIRRLIETRHNQDVVVVRRQFGDPLNLGFRVPVEVTFLLYHANRR